MPDRRLKGPVISAAAVIRNFLGRSFGTLIDPGGQKANLVLLQSRLLVRHLGYVICAFERVHEQAGGGLARNDSRPAHTSLAHQGRRVQPQLPLVDLGAVARKTMLGQERLDIANIIDRRIGPASPRPGKKGQNKEYASDRLHIGSMEKQPAARARGPTRKDGSILLQKPPGRQSSSGRIWAKGWQREYDRHGGDAKLMSSACTAP